jgi:hypothetical protein
MISASIARSEERNAENKASKTMSPAMLTTCQVA